MSVLMLLSLSAIAHAQGYVDVNTSSVIQPYYEYTSYNKANLDISGGQATCESTISGYSGITTKVTITMYLEKKTLWWWSTQASWTGTFNSYRGALSKNYAVGGGTYRVRAVYVAYSGSNSETITGYSVEVKN